MRRTCLDSAATLQPRCAQPPVTSSMAILSRSMDDASSRTTFPRPCEIASLNSGGASIPSSTTWACYCCRSIIFLLKFSSYLSKIERRRFDVMPLRQLIFAVALLVIVYDRNIGLEKDLVLY
nr:uncharacterized protein LOC109739987 [Aegilops tauschii subsp. strangulata]